MNMAFKYRGADRSSADVDRKASQSGGMYDSYIKSDVKQLKVAEGDTWLRLLPASWDESEDEKWGTYWNIDLYLHYGVGADNATYLCLEKMKGERCPICEARAESTDEDEKAQLRPSWRGLAWVINRDDEKSGPQVWGVPVTLFREINERSKDKKSQKPILIDHPEKGYDISFSRKGADLRTKYTGVEVSRDPTPIHDDERLQAKWLAYIAANPLPDVLVYYDAEHIEKVLLGTSRRRQSEDDSDAAPVRHSRRSRESERESESEEDSGSARRPRREETGDAEPPPRRARDDNEEQQPPRSRFRGRADEGDEAPPRRSARDNGGADAEDEFKEEPDDTGDEPSASAKASIERMRERRAR